MSEVVEFPARTVVEAFDDWDKAAKEARASIKHFVSDVLDPDLLEAFDGGNVSCELLFSVQTLRLLKRKPEQQR